MRLKDPQDNVYGTVVRTGLYLSTRKAYVVVKWLDGRIDTYHPNQLRKIKQIRRTHE